MDFCVPNYSMFGADDFGCRVFIPSGLSSAVRGFEVGRCGHVAVVVGRWIFISAYLPDSWKDDKHGHLCADSLDDLEALIIKVKRKFRVEVICLGGDLQCTLLEDGEFIGPRTTPSRHSNGSVRQLLVSEFCVKWKLRAVNTWPAGADFPDSIWTHYNNRWKARTQIDYILVTDSAGGSGGVVVHWPLLRLNEDHRPVAAKGFKSQIETEKQPLQYSMKGWRPCTDEADEEYKQ